MKVWRVLVANLLLVLSATTGNGGSFITRRSTPAAQQQVSAATQEITEEETGEVCEVAERFARRMHETHDFAALIGEMFVTDYAARLQHEASSKPRFLMSTGVAQQASREELMRYYVALNNSGYMVGLLVTAYEAAQSAAENENEEDDVEKLRHALPPDLLDLCKNDPILKSLCEEEQKAGAGETKPGEQAEQSVAKEDPDELIRSVEQLRSFTLTLEKAGLIARKHLDALPVKPNYLEKHKKANEEENWEAEREEMIPRAWPLSEEFYGYPEETRLFCIEVLFYHMDLIRVDGKLKILALYPNPD